MQSKLTPPLRQAHPWKWIERNIIRVVRQARVDYLPPLMVYARSGHLGV